MRAFARKLSRTTLAKSLELDRTHAAQSHAASSVRQVQYAIGNQATLRRMPTSTPLVAEDMTRAVCSSRDLGRSCNPGPSVSEMTVVSPEAAPNEEATVPDGGGSGTPAPKSPTPTPTPTPTPAPTPTPTPTPTPPTAATFCTATPTSADIKNVKKYTDGKLYGHEFDFVVDLTYSKLANTATKHEDCTLKWLEKSSRPPDWYITAGLAKDAWVDAFAKFPTSPTFDGWTKSRTKPCPGKETAKMHDPPAASVDMPARTMSFDLQVTGGGVTKSATGTQVLEPDGKGGIKTQTFTVP